MTTRVTVPRRSRRASNLASRVRVARTLLDCLSFRGALPFAASEGREVESAHKGFDRVNVFKAGRSERNGTKYARRVVRDDNIPSRTRGSFSLFSAVGTVRTNCRTRDVSFDLLTS